VTSEKGRHKIEEKFVSFERAIEADAH